MNKFGLQLVTGPAIEPISIAQAKLHLRVDFNYEDALIGALISAAREYCENHTNRVFLPQTYLLTLDQFPFPDSLTTATPAARENWLSFGGYITGMQLLLPVPKATSVTSITYQDNAGNPQILDPAVYHADFNSEPARILPVNGGSWPYPAVYVSGTVNVTFVAGAYTAATLPASIKLAMLMLVAAWYGQREAFSSKPLTAVPFAVDCLLSPYKFYQVIV